MDIENTKDLKKFFSDNNLSFLKNISSEISKIESLLEKIQNKEEKYSLFLTALSAKDFSKSNKEYFLDVKNTYSLIEKNANSLKNLKNKLTNLSTQLLSFLLSDGSIDTSIMVDQINTTLNQYSELLDDVKKDFVTNNKTVNTFTLYHSTKLLLKTFAMDLGDPLDEEFTLLSPTSNIEQIQTSYSDFIGETENKVLIISEKENKVYLPYKKSELKAYISKYPTSYYSYKNVIEKEFILPLNYFIHNQSMARFRETYALYHDREALSSFRSLQKALSLTLKKELNPAIIAACKTQKQLNNYLLCLKEKKLDDFEDFKIIYDMNPQNVNA